MNTLQNKDRYFEFLMDEYGEEIKRLIFTYVKNWATTEDLTQDVFLSVYLKIESFQGKSSIRTWIYQIAINKCKDYLRSWYYKKIVFSEKILNVINRNSPENILEASESNKDLLQDLEKLTPKHKEILILYYYTDFSLNEICSLLKLNPSTARTRLKRSREKLSTIIERRILHDN